MAALSDIFSRLIGPGATYAGPDQGIDFTGAAPIYALGHGVVTQVQATGGWYNGGILVYQLLSGPAKGRFVYTAENFSPAAGLAVGSKIAQGQLIGQATGTGAPGGVVAPGIETGFSQTGTINPYGTPQEGKGSTPPDPQALAFKAFAMTGRIRSFTSGNTGGNQSLAQLWQQAGGSPKLANLMAAISMAESGGQVGQVGGPNTDGSYDYGLWQINSSHTQFDKSKLLNDPLYNAQAAVAVYKTQGLTAWSTYNNGAYLQYVGSAGGSKYGLTRPGGGAPGTGTGSGSGSGGDVTAVLTDWYNQQDAVQPPARTETISLFSGVPILKSIPLVNDIPNPLNLFTGLGNSINSVVDFLKALAWILNPVNILRMVEFLLGIALMIFGIQAAMQASGEKSEGYETGETALSRSGLGRVSKELGAQAKAGVRAAATKGRGSGGGGGGGGPGKALKKLKPAPAPHKTRRTALRVRYEREQQVSQRRTAQRRSP